MAREKTATPYSMRRGPSSILSKLLENSPVLWGCAMIVVACRTPHHSEGLPDSSTTAASATTMRHPMREIENTHAQPGETEKPRLVLCLTASPQMQVGYGHVFECQIHKVLAGAFEENTLRLTILAGDHDRLKYLLAHAYPTVFTIGFTLHRSDEPYPLMPLSGFVDSHRYSWAIDFMNDACHNPTTP